MQWRALVGSSDRLNMTGSRWRGQDPRRGHMVPEVLGPLCGLLAEHTDAADHCYFCLWDGYGWGSAVSNQPTFSMEQASAVPRVHLPSRDYLLLIGPLLAAPRIGNMLGSRFFPQSPNLFWPADRTWCVASEIDFDSTLVGGTTALIEDILENQRLDAWPVSPADSLAYDADQINKLT